MRRGLGIDVLAPEHDADLTRFGMGITDVVKRPSSNASELAPDEFRFWAPKLLVKIRRHKPRVVCFHGLTAYRPFLKLALGVDRKPQLGAQPETIGATRIFVVPNPSPANAHFTPADQVKWYDRLADFIAREKAPTKSVP